MTAVPAALPRVHAFWIGPTLGPISAACLRSFVRMSQPITLHGYQRPADLPDGVEFSDAGQVLPPDRIIRHRKTGSYALFANVFRYKLLELVDGIYVDCDIFCIRPLQNADYVFGYEDPYSINNAVLRLPKDSELLRALNEVAADRWPIPPWLPERVLRRLRLLAEHGRKVDVQDLPWGVLGPRALTYLARQFGVDGLAQTPDVFYPVHYYQVAKLLDPAVSVDDLITSRTVCIHLYNEMLRHLDLSDIHPSSLLGRMLAY